MRIALHTHSHSKIEIFLVAFLSIEFLQSSSRPGHYKGPSKEHPPCLFRLPPWKNVNKPMNFNSASMFTLLIIHESKLAQSVIQGFLPQVGGALVYIADSTTAKSKPAHVYIIF